MPSKTILNHTLNHIEKFKPVLIAPQHGSIIPKNLIQPIISKMRNLDCGLYMLDDKESDIVLLNKTEDLLHKFFEDILSLSSFELILRNLFDYIKKDIAEFENLFVYKKIGDAKELLFQVDKEHVVKEHTFSLPPRDENSILFTKQLRHEEKIIGEIEFVFNNIDEKEKRFLNIFLDKILIPFSISFKKEISYENLRKKAITDPLTSLHNREYMNEVLADEMTRAKHKELPLSITMLDIDHFKNINDTYGHVVGDCVLKMLAQILVRETRNSDIIIRYGGEEFLIIMPLTDINGAFQKIERIRKFISEFQFCEEEISLTVSAGIAEYSGEEDIKQFIEVADKKLYRAKKEGRNKVVA
jgi:diguanylate cyclase (GGDEF)-like protein